MANVTIDIEPGLAMLVGPQLPLHGPVHTFLLGGVVGLLTGWVAWWARAWLVRGMVLARLPYLPRRAVMLASGVLGAWLHVLVDASLYPEMRPFFPWSGNPVASLFASVDTAYSVVYGLGALLFVPAVVLYLRTRVAGSVA